MRTEAKRRSLSSVFGESLFEAYDRPDEGAFQEAHVDLMKRILLKSKIHRATVTDASLHYEGSVTIDPLLMEATDIVEWEQVDIYDINNGNRLTTYAISGERGTGVICLNGAAARLVHVGDLVIICSYSQYKEEERKLHEPKIILVDEHNRIVRRCDN